MKAQYFLYVNRTSSFYMNKRKFPYIYKQVNYHTLTSKQVNYLRSEIVIKAGYTPIFMMGLLTPYLLVSLRNSHLSHMYI